MAVKKAVETRRKRETKGIREGEDERKGGRGETQNGRRNCLIGGGIHEEEGQG